MRAKGLRLIESILKKVYSKQCGHCFDKIPSMPYYKCGCSDHDDNIWCSIGCVKYSHTNRVYTVSQIDENLIRAFSDRPRSNRIMPIDLVYYLEPIVSERSHGVTKKSRMLDGTPPSAEIPYKCLETGVIYFYYNGRWRVLA